MYIIIIKNFQIFTYLGVDMDNIVPEGGGGGGGEIHNEPKWLILVSFPQKKLPHTLSVGLIPVIASIYCGKYAVPFLLGHPVIG